MTGAGLDRRNSAPRLILYNPGVATEGKTGKRRLDLQLVERGLAPSREQAQALIMAGKVRVDGQPARKAGIAVALDAALMVEGRRPFVSRGGQKLAHALDAFGLDVAGLAALDVGASTGGFTDCLLQRGARRVYAVDVGYGQLDYSLRQDVRVTVMERLNAHHPFVLPEAVDLATVDVSFISATKVLPNALPHLREGGWLIVLVKPQFEAGREQVGRGGVVRDPQVHAQVLGRFIAWAVAQGLRLRGLTGSPILGAEGNREFLVQLEAPGPSVASPIDRVHARRL